MASLRNKLIAWCAFFGLAICGIAPGACAESPPPVIPAAAGAFFESQIDPTAESNFSLALFRLWLPQTKSPVAGVLAVLPMSDRDGIPLANDPQWQAIARDWDYALLAGTFTTSSHGPPYYRAECGTGQALLSALEQIAVSSGHAELKEVPIAILGHSQGGQFALHFACWRPSRVIACATIKGGFYNVESTDAARAVPSLLITAKEDAEFRQKNIRALYDRTSASPARWAFAAEPKAAHELGRSLQLVIPFFAAVIHGSLQPFSGDLATFATQPATTPPEPGHPWFPNRDVAEIWSRFATGTLTERTPDLPIPEASFPQLDQAWSRSYDFGDVESQKECAAATFHISPMPDGVPWTSIRAFSSRSRCEVSVSYSQGAALVSVRPLVAQLPLGRLSETIYIRYLKDGNPIFGGSELDVTFHHIHPDVKLSANCFYVGVHAQPCQKTIKLTSPNGKPLKVRSVEMLTGTGATFSVKEETATSAEVIGEFAPLPESGNHSGIVALHLDEPLSTTVLVPFIGYYRAAVP
jgi:hypothetical protein